MANFEAVVRTRLRDVSGLVLSCGRDDIEEDPANPGFARRWRNRAPGLPSKPQYRLPTDPKTYDGGRFSDPVQVIFARQPQIVLTGGGQNRLKFNRASSQFMNVRIDPTSLPEVAGGLTTAFQFTKGPDNSNNQVLFSEQMGQNNLNITRRNAGGNARVTIGSAAPFGPVGDIVNGVHLAYGDGATALDWRQSNLAYANAVLPNLSQFIDGDAYIGCDFSGGNFLDGTLDAFHIWTRVLSPRERDFVWKVLSEDGTPYNAQVRASVRQAVWTDVTGDVSQGEINRLRPIVGADPFFKLATVPNAGVAEVYVQIAASVDGLTKPDSMLGGDLFALDWIEVPGGPPVYPAVAQDAGWSSVFDCFLKTSGHYTALVRRQNGGGVILHFDVEVVP